VISDAVKFGICKFLNTGKRQIINFRHNSPFVMRPFVRYACMYPSLGIALKMHHFSVSFYLYKFIKFNPLNPNPKPLTRCVLYCSVAWCWIVSCFRKK